MAFIETVPEDEASGAVAEIYEADRALTGRVPNYTRVFSHEPAVYAAWRELNLAIRGSMDLRRYELVTLAAARELRSSYCALAHGKILAEKILDADEAGSVLVDGRFDGLDEVEVAAMELARKVAADATAVEARDVERLRALGLADGEIFSIVAAAAARCFFSKTLDALGAEPDADYRELDAPLREALTVGRPIAEP